VKDDDRDIVRAAAFERQFDERVASVMRGVAGEYIARLVPPLRCNEISRIS